MRIRWRRRLDGAGAASRAFVYLGAAVTAALLASRRLTVTVEHYEPPRGRPRQTLYAEKLNRVIWIARRRHHLAALRPATRLARGDKLELQDAHVPCGIDVQAYRPCLLP